MNEKETGNPHEGPIIFDTAAGSDGSPPRGRRRSSSVGLLAAIICGGLIAFGLASILPDDWRINFRKKIKPNGNFITGKNTPVLQSGKKSGDDGNDSKKSGSGGKTNSERAKTRLSPKISTRSRQSVKIPALKAKKQTAAVNPEEKQAADLLEQAHALLAANKKKEAIQIAERILNEFAGTKAALEAENILAEKNE